MMRLRSLRTVLGVLAVSACARAPVPPAPANVVAAIDAGMAAGPQEGLFRLPPGIRPTAQSISLVIDPAQPRFSGSTDIQIRIDSPIQKFWVSARELQIEGAFLEQGGEQWTVTLEPDDARGAARVRSPRTLAAGEAVLHVDFDAPFNLRLVGVYRVKSTGGWAAYTQFESIDARRAFPCFDEPSFKIPWTVELRVPAGLQAFGNTPVAEETPVDPGTRRVRFATTRPLPSYLVAFSVGDFDVVTPSPLPPSREPVPSPDRRAGRLPGSHPPGACASSRAPIAASS